jgi:diketogulonate reductase-like aldo/keto reductase
MAVVPILTLHNGVELPQLGFGVFQVPPEEVVEPVASALAAGYRLIDTAAAYGNEQGVGRAIASSGLPRDEVFVTTKVWNLDQGYDETLAAFDRSLSALGMEVIDLYLIHWPVPQRDRYVATWRALERIYAEGRARAIGVSNFRVVDLERLAGETDVVPAVNQIELHPGFDQAELRAYHAGHGIVTEAWSPLRQGLGLLDNPVVLTIASAHGTSAAQTILRWHIQLGNVVIPKSVTPERIRANFDIFDFALSPGEMAAIGALPGGRIGPHPDIFETP